MEKNKKNTFYPQMKSVSLKVIPGIRQSTVRNVIRNQRYSKYSFFFKVIAQQFKFFDNIFFLLICSSQFFPSYAVSPLISNMAPWTFVLTMTLLKEGIDDFKRYKRDKEANSQKFKVLRYNNRSVPKTNFKEPYKILRELKSNEKYTIQAVSMPSSDIQVGDVVLLERNQRVPADCILLKCSENDAFIKTDQLDGETDWKLRIPVLQNTGEDGLSYLVKKKEQTKENNNKQQEDNSLITDRTKFGSNDCISDVEESTDEHNNSTQIENSSLEKSSEEYEKKEENGNEEIVASVSIPINQSIFERTKQINNELKDENNDLIVTKNSEVIEIEDTEKESREVSESLKHFNEYTSLFTSNYIFNLEQPHKDIYSFIGNLSSKSLSLSMDLENTMWMNTIFASNHGLALVCYTGVNTRAVLNTTTKRAKTSLISLELNNYSKFLFCISLISALILTFIRGLNYRSDATFIRFLVILSSVIPISLKVSVDTARYVHAYFIQKEDNFTVRTSNTPEELGRISYLLSDKTGTLTTNCMKMRKLHLGTVCFEEKKDIREILHKKMCNGIKKCHYEDCTGIDKNTEINEPINDAIIDRKDIQFDLHNTNTAMSFDIKSDENKNSIYPKSNISKNNTEDHENILNDTTENVLQEGRTDKEEIKNNFLKTQSNQSKLSQVPKKQNTLSNKIIDLVTAMSVCHNVTPVVENDVKSYQASSPDEIAIIEYAESIGVRLIHRSRTEITLEDYEGIKKFKILIIFPFTSESKRMGIIVSTMKNRGSNNTKINQTTNLPQEENGEDEEIAFYAKGADAIMAQIVQTNDWLKEETDNMAREGLRTLVIAKKVLTRGQYEEWNNKYHKASISIENRKEKMDMCRDELEKGLTLIGLTGVEDKLQDGVKNTLENMRFAGMKIWMLTGDKIETAYNIANSSKLFDKSGNVLVIEGITTREKAYQHVLNFYKTDHKEDKDSINSDLISIRKRKKSYRWGKKNKQKTLKQTEEDYKKRENSIKNDSPLKDTNKKKNASINNCSIDKSINLSIDKSHNFDKTYNYLVIDGKSIEVLMQYYSDQFIGYSASLDAVVCCRCSPTQKSDIATAIKVLTKKRVACIGDGGNDVSMITAADVGLGIIGKEGNQASLAADISMTQFKDISQLFFWHGRNCYKVTARLANLIIHRGSIITVMQIIFCCLFNYTPISIYQGVIMIGYTTIYTILPILCSVLSRDITRENALRYPELYKDLLSNNLLCLRNFAKWNVITFYQGSLIMLFSFWFFENEMFCITTITFSSLILNEILMSILAFRGNYTYIFISVSFSSFIYIISFFFLHSELILPENVLNFILIVCLINAIAITPSLIEMFYNSYINPSRSRKLADI